MSLAYFYGFLDGRIRQSGSLPAGHWLLEARLSALSVLAFVVELGVNQRLEEHIAQSHRPEPIALYGKTGQRRIHRATASKMIMLRRLLDGHGSREAVGRALTDGNRGIGAQYQGVQNACYSETARRAFHSTRRLAVNWDGSTHGGLDMNVGFAVDVGTGLGAYFRPMVPHISSHSSWNRVPKRAGCPWEAVFRPRRYAQIIFFIWELIFGTPWAISNTEKSLLGTPVHVSKNLISGGALIFLGALSTPSQ